MRDTEKAIEMYPVIFGDAEHSNFQYAQSNNLNLELQAAFLEGCKWKAQEFEDYLKKVLRNLSVGDIPSDMPEKLAARELGKRDIVKYIINDWFINK